MDNAQGILGGLSSLPYTPIKAYCTAVLGSKQDWLYYGCLVGLVFNIIVLLVNPKSRL